MIILLKYVEREFVLTDNAAHLFHSLSLCHHWQMNCCISIEPRCALCAPQLTKCKNVIITVDLQRQSYEDFVSHLTILFVTEVWLKESSSSSSLGGGWEIIIICYPPLRPFSFSSWCQFDLVQRRRRRRLWHFTGLLGTARPHTAFLDFICLTFRLVGQ